MVRVLVFVVFVFLVSAGLAWLADRPGDIVLNWQGYEIRTSLMVGAVGLAVVIGAILLVWALVRAIVRAPRSFETYLGRRRRDRGYKALSDGMIAVGSGDVRGARKAAAHSQTLLGKEPLQLLLSAQAAQLAGDADTARTAFESLAGETDTKVLGLHGLFVEAQRQGQDEAARHFAEQAVAVAPKVGWAGQALFEYRSRAGEWLGAMRVLETNVRVGTADKERAKVERAALLTARAMELESGDPQEARAAAMEAHRLDPKLVPAAVVASRLLSRVSDFRRSARVIEASWKLQPHPDLAEAYAVVRPGDSVRDRLKRIRKLADLRANHPEGAKALARAAIDAQEWDTARTALEGQSKSTPSEAVCLLMAEIEGRQHGDEGRVRMWLARAINAPRDPVWIADGKVFETWAPVTPVSGKVGGFVWGLPPEPPPSPVAIEIEAGYAGETQSAIGADPVPQIADTSAPTAGVTEAEPEDEGAPPSEGEAQLTSPEPPKPANDQPEKQETPVTPPVIEAQAELAAGPSEPPLTGSDPAAAPVPTATEAEISGAPGKEARPAEARTDGDGVDGATSTTGDNDAVRVVATNGASPEEAAKEPELEAAAEPDQDSAIPRPPDDPGPLPEDDDSVGSSRRRFRLF
ncbi:heme biosynthesis HemY N-terminal domain-containing protein [Bauldia sp.]|uniref:heme biosynthesis HemY N-terminal domain-containing protein n=1 Tax=Bauldia sp. TaxID=2575872 RepID=UPI003BACCAF4